MICFAVLPFRFVHAGQSARFAAIRASMAVCPLSILFPSNS